MASSSAARAGIQGQSTTPPSPSARAPWRPMPASTLFSNLEAGIDFHLGQIESVINSDAKERVAGYLRSNFGEQARDVQDKFIKKLANSALALGSRGLSRTLDALEDLPFWSNDLQLIQREGHSPIPLIDASRLKLNGDVCESCQKKIKETDGTILVESLHHYHLKCWCALDIRELVSPLRSTLIAMAKQAKSSRVILKANEKDFNKRGSKYEEYFLRSREEYESWRDQLFYKWLQQTDVKEEFRSTYRSNFEEYTDSVMRYLVDKKLPASEIEGRLLKHLEESEAKKITKRLSSMPLKALRYLGLIDEESKEQSHLVSYLESNSLPKQNDEAVAWQEKALCATTDPSAFFDGSESGLKAAIRVCNRCPVKVECLDYALQNGEMTGIWGGKTPEERKAMAQQMSSGLKIINAPKLKQGNSKQGAPDSVSGIFKFEFKQYGDVREVGERYREGYSVILNMSEAPEADRKRAIDFLAGLVFANSGNIERVGNGIFLLLPSGAKALGDISSKDSGSIDSLRNQFLA